MSMRKISSLIKTTSGAAAIEFAIVAPVLIILMLGIVEVGRAISQYHIGTKAVRDGARYAGWLEYQCGSGGFSATDQDQIRNIVVYGSAVAGTPLINGWEPSVVDITVREEPRPASITGLYETHACVPVITVQAQFPFDDLFGAYVGLDNLTMSVDHRQLSLGVRG